MPQLDVLTFYGQACTLLFLIPFVFVFFSSIILPALFRIQKVRFFFLSSLEGEASLFLHSLFQIYQAQDFVVSSSALTTAVQLDGLVSDVTEFELFANVEGSLLEINLEVLDSLFELYLTDGAVTEFNSLNDVDEF